MEKARQAEILARCCELIDGRVRNTAEPGAYQFANTWLEGATSAAVLIGKQDLADSLGRMLGELQELRTWAAFREARTSSRQ